MPSGGRAGPKRTSRIKIANQWLRQILNLLYQRRNLSRIEIIEGTGLNAASVSHALRYLLQRGVLHKAGEHDAGTGRRREVFTLNAEAGYFVTLDLEGDRVRFALTNLLGDLRCRWEEWLQFREPLSPAKVVEGIGKVTRDLDEAQLSRVLAIGVSYPGLLDAEGRLTAVNLGWTKIPLLAVLTEAFPWPVFLERDKQTCILAESWLGAAQKYTNAMFLIAEGGIGLGILADRNHPVGAHGLSGEIGHCKVFPEAEDLCNCGQKGCLEAIASGVNIVRQYAERTGAEAGSLRFADVLERARRQDPAALFVIGRAGRALGTALATAVSLLDPGIVILGGDLIIAEDVLLPLIWERIRRQTPPASLEGLKITVSGLGLDIRLKGAAFLAFRSMLEDPHLIEGMFAPVLQPAPGELV
jgi:predicted NBD/HSP70 family sugar kinase